jgi:hypothetical protein
MILSPSQIEKMLNVISKNVLLYISMNLGEAVLSEVDRTTLLAAGVDLAGLGKSLPPYFKMYLLGRLTQTIGEYNSARLKYKDFEEYLRKEQFQPLTPFEEIQYMLARHATYGHLKHLEHRMRIDSEGALMQELTRAEYEGVIKEKIATGVQQRKSIGAVISDIGHYTGDWAKDLGRIVETEMNNIFQRGRAVQIAEKNRGKDPWVYKDVYEGACRHCIALYLTHGLGSEPRLFRLSQLMANGTNIGVPVARWKGVIGSTHPWCRCNLRELPEHMIWSKEKKHFIFDAEGLRRAEAALGLKGKIKITIGDEVIEV